MTVLRVTGVTKRFGGLKAVNQVSLEVQQGEIVGLIGPNGAGKTTLFDIITGFCRPDAGAVDFMGQCVTGLPPYKISNLGIGRTFQKIRLFPEMTAIENVMVGGLRTSTISEARAMARNYLEFVGIGHKADAPASDLSTGQRKRLELARAMALKPTLLLLDEVTGGIDRRGVEEIIPLLRRVRDAGFAILVIEHNIRVIRELSNRVIVLHLGEKLAEGTPIDVLANRAVIDVYLGRTHAGH